MCKYVAWTYPSLTLKTIFILNCDRADQIWYSDSLGYIQLIQGGSHKKIVSFWKNTTPLLLKIIVNIFVCVHNTKSMGLVHKNCNLWNINELSTYQLTT